MTNSTLDCGKSEAPLLALPLISTYLVIPKCVGGCDGVRHPYADSASACTVCGGLDVVRVAMKRAVANFWRFTPKANGAVCWLWNGVPTHGYGTARGYRYGVRVQIRAHRLSYMLARRVDVPSEIDVCHTCDIRNCVNPGHLFLGTRLDNMRDCAEKGRTNRPIGDRHPQVKLSPDDVRRIRSRAANGEKYAPLARQYGVHGSTVSRIARNIKRREVA